ncbi:hypothetical protein HU200_027904 [Digitaria exilis]|uniref:F-box domain-containing protein n=1 Tax=Digitaria exilis TaxID=1010633 RepID=A0A835BSJ0_9POAL|nr:hypothetical protein HU200_027904 [Digitaria exilis]
MGPPSPAAVPEEIVEEVLIRVPPDDPATLLRVALVCKRLCRIVAGASFRRRFRELHPRPPMLGFLQEHESGAEFVPTSSFRPPRAVADGWRVVDARHGRVLLLDLASCSATEAKFLVWDPVVTDGLRRLPALEFQPDSWSAAVLCAVAGCDHLDCRRGGPFLVVVVDTDVRGVTRTCAHVYSSELGAWSESISVLHTGDGFMRLQPALVGNALYFNYVLNTRIMEYHLGRRQLSEAIGLPSAFCGGHVVLMEAEDGELGFVTIQDSKLYTWSREVGPDGYARWALRRIIKLDKLLPVSDCTLSVSPYVNFIIPPPYVVAVADGVDIIFMLTDDGMFSFHLKSSRIKKIGNFMSSITYMSFCTPALNLVFMGDEGPSGDA